jgi:hypothetical protein
MKKLILAGTAVVACALVPAATASAAETLKCTFEGTASFPSGNLKATPANLTFEFVEGEVGLGKKGGECGGKKVELGATKTKVEGKGELSCLVSQNTLKVLGTVEGKGKVSVEGKETFELSKFNLVGVTAFVKFEAAGENKTEKFTTLEGPTFSPPVPLANFVNNAGDLQKCPTVGIEHLKFEAEAEVEVS